MLLEVLTRRQYSGRDTMFIPLTPGLTEWVSVGRTLTGSTEILARPFFRILREWVGRDGVGPEVRVVKSKRSDRVRLSSLQSGLQERWGRQGATQGSLGPWSERRPPHRLRSGLWWLEPFSKEGVLYRRTKYRNIPSGNRDHAKERFPRGSPPQTTPPPLCVRSLPRS